MSNKGKKINDQWKKAPKAMRITNACILGILIFITIVALAFLIADQHILHNSLSLYVMNFLINNPFGQIILKISTSFFLPIISSTAVYVEIVVFSFPVILILINIFIVGRLKFNIIAKIVCRMLIYLCLIAFVTTLSLSIIYTNYAFHVTKNFILSDRDVDLENIFDIKFNKIQNIVSENKHIAQNIINAAISELQDPAFSLDSLDDIQYFEAAESIAICFQIKGTVNSKDEHYLRNYFYRAPKTLDDMVKAINDKSVFDWYLLRQEQTVYHMQNENGAYNLKFVSEDGYHEAIYNKDGVLLTEKNDPVNMGTFNYADPTSAPALHAALDVLPYYSYGNCPASPVSSPENYDFENNPDAKKHWSDTLALLKYE